MYYRFLRERFRRSLSKKIILVIILMVAVVLVTQSMNRTETFQNRNIHPVPHLHSPLIFSKAIERSEERSSPQACIHPKLALDDPVMMKFYKKMSPVSCKGTENWVYVQNGTFMFSEAIKKSTRTVSVQCDYFPLIRGPGDYKFKYGDPIKNIQSGTPLVSEFFKVKCNSSTGNKYENIHAGIHNNKTIREYLDTHSPPANGLGLSIAMLGFDSMSQMSWHRRMTKTRDYMVNQLKAIELQGYNNMGDGTPAALFPILTGKHEQELPEARRNFKGAKTVDEFPWLWKDFRDNGYVTSWADAEINIAPFNYRLLGFEHSPAHFFMRPFYLAVAPTYKKYEKYCHGAVPKHKVWFDYFRDIFHMYQHDPKFLIHFYSTLSHEDNNLLSMADDDLYDLIHELQIGGFLNNTLLVVMADHGARFANVRETLSGKLEERMPYIALKFPHWFEAKHPDIMKNIRTNAHRLTSPLDLHETFMDSLRFDGAGLGNVNNRAISLYKEIPKERTCAHADIAPHWCACMDWKTVNISAENSQKALTGAVNKINSFTKDYRKYCAELFVGEVTMATSQMPNSDFMRFQKTTGDRGLEPVMAKGNVTSDQEYYQLTFYTEPGHGQFEVTVELTLSTKTVAVSPKAISRINKYGDDPACILDKNREIRQYCYCKNNIKGNVTGR